jgi:hypothetical protein
MTEEKYLYHVLKGNMKEEDQLKNLHINRWLILEWTGTSRIGEC